MDGDESKEPTDRELVQRWCAGDKRAGQFLIRRHYPSIRKFFINAVGDQEAAELTQDTFVKLTRKVHTFQFRSTFRTYLFSIARYTLYDFFKKVKREFTPLEHSVADVEAVRQSELVSRLRRYDTLLDHMRALPLEHKQLLELYYWHKLTAKELGEVFDLTPGAAKARILEIKKKLAKAVSEAKGPLVSEDELDVRLDELGKLFEQGPRDEGEGKDG